MIEEKELQTIPYVAYLAHPYGGEESNITDSVVVAKALRDHYPNLIIVNPLTNLSYMQGEEESKLLACCKELLISCDFLILSDGWKHSPGCNEEFKEALKHDMDIMTIEKDEKGCIQLVNFESEPPKNQKDPWLDIVRAAEKLQQDDDLKLLIVAAAGPEDKDGKTLNHITIKLTGEVRDIVNDTASMLGEIAYQIGMALANDKEAGEVLKAEGLDMTEPRKREIFAEALLHTAASAVKDVAKRTEEVVNHAH